MDINDSDGEEVQVYEDPFVADEAAVNDDEGKPVLEELPIPNEQAHGRRDSDDSASHSGSVNSADSLPENDERHRHHKTTSTGSIVNNGANGTNIDLEALSPQERADTLRSRRLLGSGIERIRAKTLDAHGFRRVQDLVRSPLDIWGPNFQKFDELFVALLEYLAVPGEALKAPPIKVQNLKTQVLATVRAMMTLYRAESRRFVGKALTAVLRAAGDIGSTSHLATDLETTASEISSQKPGAQTGQCIDAVLNLLDSASDINGGSTDDSENVGSAPPALQPRTLSLSLVSLSHILRSATQSGKASSVLSSEQLSQMARIAVRLLNDTDPDVRRADLELCVELHEAEAARSAEGGEACFWKELANAKEGQRNLIAYYLARRGKAAAS